MNYYMENKYWYLIIVLVLGLFYGFAELIARYHDTKYIMRTWQSYMYAIVNGSISILALFLLKQLRGESFDNWVTININDILIAGIGGMMILRSSLFSITHNNKKLDVGLAIIVQTFLDLIEKGMKTNAAKDKITAMNKIMDNIDFEEAKNELSTICINSVENFSSEESIALNKRIEEISSIGISNKNKCIQLGICISRYCNDNLLEEAINVLGLKQGSRNKVSDNQNIDFYIDQLLKLGKYGKK